MSGPKRQVAPCLDWTRLPPGRAARGPLGGKVELCALTGATAPPTGYKTACSAGSHRLQVTKFGRRVGENVLREEKMELMDKSIVAR